MAMDDNNNTGGGSLRPSTGGFRSGSGGEGSAAFEEGSLISYTYRVESLLARGGMGEVYRTTHAEIGTQHAIKIIRDDLADDPKIIELFRREAAVLRTVRNDAVVAYDGVLRDEAGRVYLVMEFVDGPKLTDYLKERTLTPDEVRQLRNRLADGLAAAHEKGIIHRDMSPDNVILGDGKLENATIIDFGIAKLSDSSATTIIGEDFAGRYAYASPEQFGLFGGAVDGRSDIYSLGLVLAAAATGEGLYMGEARTSLVSVIEARRAVPDMTEVPEELRDELSAMLQPDPADRPQSMREIIKPVLTTAQSTEPPRRGSAPAPAVHTRPPEPTTAQQPPAASSGSKVGLIAAAGVVVALLAGGFFYFQSTQQDQAQIAAQQAAEKKAAEEAAAKAAAEQKAAEEAAAAKAAAEQKAAEEEAANAAAEQKAAEEAAAAQAAAEQKAAEEAAAAKAAAEKKAAEEATALAAAEKKAAEEAAAKAIAEKQAAEEAAAKAAAEMKAAEEAAAKALAEKEAAEAAAAKAAAEKKAAEEAAALAAAEKKVAEKLRCQSRCRAKGSRGSCGKAAAEQKAAEKPLLRSGGGKEGG